MMQKRGTYSQYDGAFDCWLRILMALPEQGRVTSRGESSVGDSSATSRQVAADPRRAGRTMAAEWNWYADS
jgi:hypothetical protein